MFFGRTYVFVNIFFVGAIIDLLHCTPLLKIGGFLDTPKRKRNRLLGYDYSTSNAYFITICTQQRRNVFWNTGMAVVDCPQDVPLSEQGYVVKQCIQSIPQYYPAVAVDHFVIMPNHVHLLLQIHSDCGRRSMIAPTISSVIRQMKGKASKQIGFSVWQKGFYDHVIRNDEDYRQTWKYIEGNPGKWAEDELYIPPAL